MKQEYFCEDCGHFFSLESHSNFFKKSEKQEKEFGFCPECNAYSVKKLEDANAKEVLNATILSVQNDPASDSPANTIVILVKTADLIQTIIKKIVEIKAITERSLSQK